MLPQEIFRKEHSETFPVFLDTKYQFPRQGWSSLILFKSKIFNGNGQILENGGGGGGGWRQQNFQLFIIANYFL